MYSSCVRSLILILNYYTILFTLLGVEPWLTPTKSAFEAVALAARMYPKQIMYCNNPCLACHSVPPLCAKSSRLSLVDRLRGEEILTTSEDM